MTALSGRHWTFGKGADISKDIDSIWTLRIWMIKQRNRIHNKFQLQRSLSNFTKMLFFRLSWWLDLNIYKTCGWIQLKNAQKKIKTTANEIFIFLTLWRKKYRSFQNLRFGDLKIILYRLKWINLNYIESTFQQFFIHIG